MQFNERKCVHIRFYANPNTVLVPYSINHSFITTSDHLGVIMSADLSWSKHHHHIISKAYASLGLIRHTFHSSSKRQLYLSLVRSQLTYSSPVWRPHLIKDMISIERVQRRATKYNILGDYTSDYKSRLSSLHLPLMYFLELCDILFFCKVCQIPC